MAGLAIFVLFFLASQVSGASDDFHVEQFQNPHVEDVDPGTHMRAGRSQFHGHHYSNKNPQSSSSQHEYHEEQRYFNGQPVYEKRHERRYENGRLVHEDGHEEGNPSSSGVNNLGGDQSMYGMGGNNYRSSSSSNRKYESTGSYNNQGSIAGQGRNTDGVEYGGSGSRYGSSGLRSSSSGGSYSSRTSGGLSNNIQSEVERLRQQIHQGSSVVRSPATSSSVHEQKREESHFVNGQQVYRSNDEKKYEDGRLVHDVEEEEGNKGVASTGWLVGSSSGIHNQENRYQSNVINQNSRPSTSFRASYWRPGDRSRNRNRNNFSQSSSSSSNAYQPSHYQTSHRRTNQIQTEAHKPAYRASYTPSRSAGSNTQRSGGFSQQGATSPITTSSTSNRQHHSSSSGYRTPLIEAPVGPAPNYRQGVYHYQNSYSNRQQSSGTPYEHNTESSVPDVESESSILSSSHHSSSHDSSNQFRPTEALSNSQTTRRITHTHSVPYSLRSSTYQPSRFANYSAWSHWKKESPNIYQPSTTNDLSRQSHYQHSNNYDVNRPAYVSSSNIEEEHDSPVVLTPGYLYEDNHIENERHNGIHQSSSISRVSQREDHSDRPDNSIGSSYSVNSMHTRDGSIIARPNTQTDMSIMVNVGEGDSIRLGSVQEAEVSSEEVDQERYDISPLVDGDVGNEVVRTNSGSDNSHHTSGFTSENNYNNAILHQNSNSGYHSGPTIGTTNVSNRATNTLTSHVQPKVSTFKLETRTSRRYLNGKLVSETKFNRYYENGALVHENQTDRSRDEMLTEGIDVTLFDLSARDVQQYGMIRNEASPMPHSQRFEVREEKEYVNGKPVYHLKHERHFQDGELVNENHDENDGDEIIGGNDYQNYVLSGGFGNSGSSRQDHSSYSENQHSNAFSTEGSSRNNIGNSYNSGVDETVKVSLSPISRTHKTEIRQEQEYRDGQQVYDMTHEKQYEDGNLVHEDKIETGPDALGTNEHHDALYDILSGRTLSTASNTRHRPRPSTSHSVHTTHGNNIENIHGGNGVSDRKFQTSSRNRGYESNQGAESYQIDLGRHQAGGQTEQQIGTNLLSSGHLTSVIGSGMPTEGSNSGYYSTVGGSNAAHSGANQHSESINSDRNSEASIFGTTGHFGISEVEVRPNHVGSGTGHSTSHQSEIAVEERYENGQLVSGREHNKEWKNNDLIRHDARRYGEGDQRSGHSSSDMSSPGYSSPSGFESSGSQSSYGASASFGTQSVGHGTASSGGEGRYIVFPESSRNHMEVDEHYENGQLVRGHKEEKEWENDQLQRHDLQRYGEGDQRSGHSSSDMSSPGYSSPSGFESSRSQSSYGASASFGTQSVGHGTASSGGEGRYIVSPESSRNHMEVEEHYENGQLVRGHKEEKEWKNDQLQRHDLQRYGEGNSRGDGSTSHSNSRHSSQSSSPSNTHSSSRVSSHSSSSSSSSRSVFQDSTTGACAGSPCVNGGSCVNGSNGFVCFCTFGFKGSRCDEAYCPKRYCRHEGQCQLAEDGSQYCNCTSQYTGPRCDRRVATRG